jgi:thiol-disulfide isomerase/thioredoxin
MSSKKHLRKKSKERFWTPMRTVLTLVVLAAFAAFGVSSCNSTDNSSGKGTPVVQVAPEKVPAQPAAAPVLPPNVLGAEFKSVSGAPIRLSSYSGKVLILNFWATWCGPCRNEIPELVRLHKQYQAQGLEVVGLTTENPELSAEKVKDFVKEFNVDYKVGWSTPEVAFTLMRDRDAIPQSFVISRTGQIVKRFIGFNANYTPPQLKQAIEDALKS